MTTIELAKKKWARKMRDAGPRWKKGVTDKTGRYKEGLGRFAGVTPGATMPSHWKEGVDAVTPEDFAKAVAGKEDYWAERLKEAIAS
ncbi:MAG: hypothetical protein QXF61_04410 [Nitrososphaeria archaeon]